LACGNERIKGRHHQTEGSVQSPLLYSLTDLQQDANIRFGFSAKQTLEIAQGLYERKKCLAKLFWELNE